MRKDSRYLAEDGAGTVLALILVFLAVSAAFLGSLFSNQLLEFTRLEALTESIALGAGDALLGANLGYPCIVAKDMAAISQLELVSCRIVGFEVFIDTRMESLGIDLRSRARAGPE
jgi:hypothetical protein